MADIDLTIESQATAPVEMEVSAGQVIPAPVDDTLTIRGMAADAKAAGDLIRQNTADIAALQEAVEELDPGGGSAFQGPIVFPQQFGAKGDGETDDTEALSEALNRSDAVIDGANHSYHLTELALTERKNLVIQNFRFYHGISITLKHCENIIFHNSSRFVLRHKQGSGKIEVFAHRNDIPVSAFTELSAGAYAFTSGTAGTLRFGGAPNSDRSKSYYNGKITDASVFYQALSDAQICKLLIDTDLTPHDIPDPVYDVADDARFVAGTGLTMDGTFAIDTGILLLENTKDFTIIAQFRFANMAEDGAKPNFTFYPVFSAMSADMPSQAHTGHTDKGFDVGLSMQNGKDMSATARGGFIAFRRDWRYVNSIDIDNYNYSNYYNNPYTVIVRRENGVITLYDRNLVELGRLTGEYATAILSGHLTLGAKMGYDGNYTSFFKGVISEFQVYDCAVELQAIEQKFPSIADNDVSKKGAVTYHLSNKNNTRKSVRYALVEVNYDLGEYNSPEYTVQYPQAFGIRLDEIYDDVLWVPCSSSKRIVFHKLCKWSAAYDPFASWDMEIVNPGTVPNLKVTIEGVKVLLLSKQEAVPDTVDATDFNISWDGDLSALSVGNSVIGYAQYIPDDAVSGLTLTAVSDDPAVATASVSGQNVTVTGVAPGETLVHVSIPYGVEYVYDVVVPEESGV